MQIKKKDKVKKFNNITIKLQGYWEYESKMERT